MEEGSVIIICCCHNVSDCVIKELIKQGLVKEDICAQTKCGTNCGTCVPHLEELMSIEEENIDTLNEHVDEVNND